MKSVLNIFLADDGAGHSVVFGARQCGGRAAVISERQKYPAAATESGYPAQQTSTARFITNTSGVAT